MNTNVVQVAPQGGVDDGVAGCRICGAISAPHRESWDEPIRETANFVVVPSLGSLVPGWLLVFPKEHRRALAECGLVELRELQELRLALRGILIQAFASPVAEFEHGAVTGGAVGCGVFHAHLHMVPTSFNLLAFGHTMSPSLEWREVGGLEDVWQSAMSTDYLTIEQDQRAFVSTGDRIPSQFFRRAMASALGRPEDWDWKTNPRGEVIEHTITRLTSS